MEASMTEEAPPLARHDLEAKIVERCWADEEFRKEFSADPAGAFVRYLEIPAARLPKISVHQEEPGSWHIVLPARPSNTDEISGEELERIAGGVSGISQVLSLKTLTPSIASVAGGVAASGAAVASVAVSVEKTAGW
jgi:hypothetical protein